MEKADGKGTGMKQLKVDNWSTFFLQRLQLLFAKGDACDITLKFHTGQELKVHSIVLRTCTAHFDSLPKIENVINLPEVYSYTALFPIINFMYSGKLEFKPDLQGKLLAIAKLLNITILLKLLLAQKDGGGTSGTTVRAKQVSSPSVDGGKTTQQIILQQTLPSPGLFQGKKLPFWRKRAFPIKFTDRKPRIEEEPGPIRFNLPVTEELAAWWAITSPSFSSLSYDMEPIIRAPLKRESSPPPQRRVLESRLLATHDSDSDDDRFPTYSSDEENPPTPPPPPPPPTLKPCLKSPSTPSPSPKRVRFCLGPEEKEPSTSTTPLPQSPGQAQASPQPQASLQTQQASPQPQALSPTPLQSQAQVQPQQQSQLLTQHPAQPQPPPQPQPQLQAQPQLQPQPQFLQQHQVQLQHHQMQHQQSTTQVSITSPLPTGANHAKIIAEVLRKYPDLVKNKNIKLKISAPKGKVENGLLPNDEKASYVVLRPAGKSNSPVHVSQAPSNSTKIGDQNVGPFFCDHCPDIKFETYYNLRKHLQDEHGEKHEARVCEYCGYKASKRNLHLHHMLTKHNIQPPPNIKFPKCGECSFVALTDSFLVKHINSAHQGKVSNKETIKEFQCDICKSLLRNQASLNAHKMTCKPGNEPRQIICDLCKMPFRTNVHLNAHLKECQGKPESETSSTVFREGEQPVEMIEVPIIEAVNMEKGDHTLVQIPSGIILADNQNMALLPSSESEGLNNVATGIATSIGLTVALPQDQQAVILLHGNGPEYIVPDFLEGSFAAGQIAYTSQNQVIYLGSTPGNGNQQEVLHLEEVKINQAPIAAPSVTGEVVKESETLPTISGKNTNSSGPIENKQLISQNVIINVERGVKNATTSQLTEESVILIEDSNDVDTSKHGAEVTKNEVTPSNTCSVIIIPDDDKKIQTHSSESEQSGSVVSLPEVASDSNNPSKENTELLETKEGEKSERIILETGSGESSGDSNSQLMQSEESSVSHICTNETEVVVNNEVPTSNSASHETIKETVETLVDTSKEMIVVETQQNSSDTEQMQVDEGREDMIVDDEKDGEEMDVEENVDSKESKDAMDVEENDKTGDDRVDSLVKDWGFDDDEPEEINTDPNAKPLRPEIEIANDLPL